MTNSEFSLNEKANDDSNDIIIKINDRMKIKSNNIWKSRKKYLLLFELKLKKENDLNKIIFC